MPRNAGEGGQNPSLSSRESTATCVALAFPSKYVSQWQTQLLSPGGKPKGSLVSARGLAAAPCFGRNQRGIAVQQKRAYLRNWRGLGSPDGSSSPNKRSRQDLRPSKKTSWPRSLAAVRLTPCGEEDTTAWSKGASRSQRISKAVWDQISSQ